MIVKDYKLNNLYLGRYSDAAVYAQGNVLIYFLVPKKVLDYDKLEVPERAVFPQGKVLASKDNPDDRYLSLHARLKSPDNELQLLITVRGDDTLTVSRAKETPLKALQSIVKHRDSFPRVKSGQPITPIN